MLCMIKYANFGNFVVYVSNSRNIQKKRDKNILDSFISKQDLDQNVNFKLVENLMLYSDESARAQHESIAWSYHSIFNYIEGLSSFISLGMMLDVCARCE